MDDSASLTRAEISLEGLSIGDAFGQRFFSIQPNLESLIRNHAVPAAPWNWTDDTAMALSVVEVLRRRRGIDQDALARCFAERYAAEPARGYGATAHQILRDIGLGVPWRQAAGSVFEGSGSMGNGAAMRVAPLGGYFADDLEEVVRQAILSAQPTHAHPEGQAGAVAVAVAAAMAWRMRGSPPELAARAMMEEVRKRTPAGETLAGLERAVTLGTGCDPGTAVAALGNGSRVISSDTVPFALWCAARHLGDFEEALWVTVSGLGDRDTTCAIVGGIIALRVGREGLPVKFLRARETLEPASGSRSSMTRP